MALSYGFVETQGLIGSIEAADTMLKTAKVRLVERREIGSGLVTIIIEGDLDACQAAVDAGKAAAERMGQFISCNVIPRPFDDTEALVLNRLNPVGPADPPTSNPPVRTENTNQRSLYSKISTEQAKEKKSSGQNVKPKVSTARSGAPKTENSIQKKIIDYLARHKNGANINQLSTAIKKDTTATRVLLKQLIDQDKIEKVQQRYYLLER